jgi:hypothetical protein
MQETLPSGIHLFISLLNVNSHSCSILKKTNHHFSSWQRIQGECKLEKHGSVLIIRVTTRIKNGTFILKTMAEPEMLQMQLPPSYNWLCIFGDKEQNISR